MIIITPEIILKIIAWYSVFIIAIYMSIRSFKNYLTIKDENNKRDNVRLIIFAFFTFQVLATSGDLVIMLANIQNSIDPIVSTNYEVMTWVTICVGLMITTQITLIAYTNKYRQFYFSAYFFYGGMVIFFLLTGFQGLHAMFIQIAGILALAYFYYYGLRFKSNQVLGFGIFCTLTFIGSIVYFISPIVWAFVFLINAIYGFFYVRGKIIFFKPIVYE